MHTQELSIRLKAAYAAITALMLCAATWAAAQAPAGALAYVPNEGSGTISVIDTDTDQVIGELPGGSKPRGLAVGADRRWLYVSDQPHNSLQLVDLGTRTLGTTIALGESPEGVSISPDGRWVVAAVEGKNEIAVTDTRSNTLAFTIKVQGKNPEHTVFSPNGRLLFVSAEEGEAVDIIDFAGRKQVAQGNHSFPHCRANLKEAKVCKCLLKLSSPCCAANVFSNCFCCMQALSIGFECEESG